MADRTVEAREVEVCEQETALERPHEAAVEHVRETFEETGFRQVTQFSPSDRIQEVPGPESGPYTVLGFGIPDAAEHALEAADERVGALFPCNVVIWAEEPGVQRVYSLDTMRLAPELGFATEDESWGALVAQLEKLMAEAFDGLRTADGE